MNKTRAWEAAAPETILYSSRRQNRTWRIAPASQKTFHMLQKRWLIALTSFIVLFVGLTVPVWISAALSIAIGAFLQYRWTKFLANMPHQPGVVQRKTVSADRSLVLMKAGLLLVVAVLLAADSFVSETMLANPLLQVACWVCAVAIAGYAVWTVFQGKN